MFIAKLLIVPFFILLVSLAGRRWGTKVAGILSGMPVVAGPIVVLMAIDQGMGFGLNAAIAGISGVVSLLSFGISHYWLRHGYFYAYHAGKWSRYHALSWNSEGVIFVNSLLYRFSCWLGIF